MLNIRAIVSGALVLWLIALVMGLLFWLLGDGRASAPQILTLSSLLSFAGFLTARQCREAGLLHGMLAGLLGGALLLLMAPLLPLEQSGLAPFQPMGYKRALMLLVVCGLWGSTGGLFADIARASRARRAQRRAAQQAQKRTTTERQG
jgi:hypothetical protein